MNARIKIISAFLSVVLCTGVGFKAHAGVLFSDLSLGSKDALLFTVKNDIPGTKKYESVFLTKLGKNSTLDSPKILTCFPEKMEVLDEGKNLQVRNRYGTAWYSFGEDKLTWISRAEKLPVGYSAVNSQSVSPDGRWICFVRADGICRGSLVIMNAVTMEERILVDSQTLGGSDVNIRWAPDSRFLLYENNGSIYFETPESLFKNVRLSESYRRIGQGYIDCVRWTEEGDILYINGDIIYRIYGNELYTRGLYASLVGNGTIVGRLSSAFDSMHDKFFCDPNGTQIITITGNNLITYCTLGLVGYDYAKINAIYPLSALGGNPFSYDVFWTSERKPLLWIDMISYSSGKKVSSLFTLFDRMARFFETENSVAPVLSPDRRFVAYSGPKKLCIFDALSQKPRTEVAGEEIHSLAWRDSRNLIAGGENSVRVFRVPSSESAKTESSFLFLSSAQNCGWERDSVYAVSSGKKYFYKEASSVWSEAKLNSGTEIFSEKNGKFRVFTGASLNKLFDNAIYVRSLSGGTTTYSVFPETDEEKPDAKKIALVFDATDSADGVAFVLNSVNFYGIKTTFFINGEFIRRYPLETVQLAYGADCASGFYSNANLVSDDFAIDADFIRRGLVRNEDEFFSATGKELALLWHAPEYRSSELMRKAGSDAGYRYVNALSAENDCESSIEKILSSLSDGTVLSVNVGKSGKARSEYVFEKINYLIASILDSGYEIVDVREIIK